MQSSTDDSKKTDRKDLIDRAELPERNSTYQSPLRRPASPHNRVSSPGLESVKDLEESSKSPNSEPAEKEFYTRYHTDPEVHHPATRKFFQQKKWIFGALALLTCLAWHIFYISANNTITEIINSNKTNVWSPGPINHLNLQPMNDPNVGLQACWYGSFYSDVSYNHSPVPGQSNNTTSQSDQSIGIHLWYAKNPTTFQSVGWTYGENEWNLQQTFESYNGHAGVGCYSWGPGSNTYVFFINMENELNILWKDLNTTLKSTSRHPIDQWNKANVAIPVYQNSSVGFTNYLYIQNPDLSIGGFNISWAAENTSIIPNQDFIISGKKGLPGTHLSVTALPDTSGGNSLLAFYQTNGTDITEFVRDLDAGQWTSSTVPIPNQ
ncbi:MAG: hypothetical protein Q9179_006973 [Wetmoreana sp. 5 TL-2023]